MHRPGDFKAGVPRHPNAGRRAGTPNKAKALDVEAKLKSLGIDVIEEMVKLLPQLPVEKQMQSLNNLLPYITPTRRAIEVLPASEEVESATKNEVYDLIGKLAGQK